MSHLTGPVSHHAPGAAGCVDGAAARLVYPTISAEIRVETTLCEHVKTCGDVPVSAIRRALRDAVVKKNMTPTFRERREKRSSIKEFSHQSRMRLWMAIRNCGVVFRSLLTITYPREFPCSGPQTKKHLKAFAQWLRDNFHGIRGIWFLEFQLRGAPHYHILLDVDLASYGLLTTRRRRKTSPGADSYQTSVETEAGAARAWYGIVGSGDPRHLRAGVSWEVLESIEAAERYAAKHAVKPHQKAVPEGFERVGRFWGQIGGVRVLWEDEEYQPYSTEEVFRDFEPGIVVSTKGKVRKYLERTRNE